MTSNTSSRKSNAAASAASAEPTLDESSTPTLAESAPEQDTLGDDGPAEVEAPIADVPAKPVTPAADSEPVAESAPDEDPLPANRVEVALAHPIDKERDLTFLGLQPKEGGYKPGDKIRVTRAAAQSLISGGYAKDVDPENKAAVEAVLAAPAKTDA